MQNNGEVPKKVGQMKKQIRFGANFVTNPAESINNYQAATTDEASYCNTLQLLQKEHL